ncbi:MAG: ankyrin repeat domain-containing protein [Verrucomicrobia bacterium]|nr:ankyrin repeat domain-containing protein [Verrucomicrobiota bacterium]
MLTQGHSFDEVLDWLRTDKSRFIRAMVPISKVNDFRGIHGESFLHYCAIEGWSKEVECLLALGADPNVRSRFESTPLMDAALVGHEEIVKLLIRAGAQIDARNRAGETALDGLLLMNLYPNIRLLLAGDCGAID